MRSIPHSETIKIFTFTLELQIIHRTPTFFLITFFSYLKKEKKNS